MLSKKGIDKLEKIMLANKEHYEQNQFAQLSDCGTSFCAAGFCRLLEVGEKKFNKEALAHAKVFNDKFVLACETAGRKLLDIEGEADADGDLPQIFDRPREWPNDLYSAYEKARGPMARVKLFIEILRTRTRNDGSIRE